MTSPTDHFTSEERMFRLLSECGVVSFADHNRDQEQDDGVVLDCIEQSTDEINLRLSRRYELEDLAGNRLLAAWATVIACRLLCIRRGNGIPESIESEFWRIMREPDGLLARVGDGAVNLPGVGRKPLGLPRGSNVSARPGIRSGRYELPPTVRVTSRTRYTNPQADDQVVTPHGG